MRFDPDGGWLAAMKKWANTRTKVESGFQDGYGSELGDWPYISLKMV